MVVIGENPYESEYKSRPHPIIFIPVDILYNIQFNMRRSNMLSLMLVVLLASSAACQNQPLYDSEASKVELQKRFDRYSSDLTRLR